MSISTGGSGCLGGGARLAASDLLRFFFAIVLFPLPLRCNVTNAVFVMQSSIFFVDKPLLSAEYVRSSLSGCGAAGAKVQCVPNRFSAQKFVCGSTAVRRC